MVGEGSELRLSLLEVAEGVADDLRFAGLDGVGDASGVTGIVHVAANVATACGRSSGTPNHPMAPGRTMRQFASPVIPC